MKKPRLSESQLRNSTVPRIHEVKNSIVESINAQSSKKSRYQSNMKARKKML